MVNDVIKPWDEINALLVERYAFQPDLSDLTRLAASLAISIKHQVDLRGLLPRNSVDQDSPENRLMSDVADAAKHGKLYNPARDNHLYVVSHFEYDPPHGFRFIRNAIVISHARVGERDFLETSLAAIRYWVTRLGITINWSPSVAEGPAEFYLSAFLYFNPKFCINMSQTRIKFFERTASGNYQPVDPPEVKFEVYEYPQESSATPS